ncbi:MAG: germination protein YpeB [Oscillospiraceae bacterium]|nr:germination protein YpeB [Oscillospiraceae bacterium]
MRKRKAIRWISYLLAAAVGLGAFAALESRRALRAEREARYRGEYAFSALCDAVSGMDAALRKTRYAVSPGMTASLCAEAYARALAASAALSSLPFPIQELEQTASFLARTGDYAAWLLRKTGGGEAVTEEERENLRSLGDAAALLSDNLRQLREDRSAGEGTDAAAELPPLSDSFLQMEQEFPELPSLVYDGPFSAAVAERPPRMTEGAEEIAEDAAALVAAGFLGMRSNQVHVEGPVDGKIPVWRVTAGDYTLAVSRRGGYVVQAISSRVPTRSVYSVEKALEAARTILRSHDYRGMEESYHIAQGNELTATFCARQGETICYPDMVKVTVAMDNGELLRFDAEAYLTSHARRDLPAPEADAGAMRGALPEGLAVLSERLAVIPTPGAEEIFCREFVCEDGEGQHYLVYFNAVTGVQERILILLEDESGTLSL